MIVGAALLALGAVFVVLGFRAPQARRPPGDRGSLAYFSPVQRGRFLVSSVLPFTLGFYALVAVGLGNPLSFEFWAFWAGVKISGLALFAVERTGRDFVDVGELGLTFQQMGNRHSVLWSDFERVTPKGSFQLFVYSRESSPGVVLYITTMHLSGDNREIQRAIEDAAHSAANRRR